MVLTNISNMHVICNLFYYLMSNFTQNKLHLLFNISDHLLLNGKSVILHSERSITYIYTLKGVLCISTL